MKSLTFIIISLGSGALAGLILSGMNMFVVEPLIDKAIDLETAKAITSGENDPILVNKIHIGSGKNQEVLWRIHFGNGFWLASWNSLYVLP